jgi:UDP-glucose 4-epimerase
VTEELLAAGAEPKVLTRSLPAAKLASRLPDQGLTIGDAGDPAILDDVLEGVGTVLYTAGGLLPAASEREPERDAELTLTPLRTVLAALAERPAVRLIYLSSGGTVYGDPEQSPTSEDEPPRPRGVYGGLHLLCEEEVRAASERGQRARILRCSTVYGEGQRPDRGQGVIATFLSRIERGEPIELYGGSGTVRDYLYVGDLARIMLELMPRDEGPLVLNVGSGEGTSLEEILELTEAEVGRPAQVHRHDERGFEVHRIVLDVSRLRGLVSVETTPLTTGIAFTHRWLGTLAGERA